MKLVLDEVAWAAGLFEGEGCFSRGRMPSAIPLVSLAMTDRDVVERFAAVVGVGRVAPKKTKPPWKPQWTWWVQGDADFEFVADLFWPYLGERRKARVEELRQLRCDFFAEVTRERTCPECSCLFRPRRHTQARTQVYCGAVCRCRANNRKAREACA